MNFTAESMKHNSFENFGAREHLLQKIMAELDKIEEKYINKLEKNGNTSPEKRGNNPGVNKAGWGGGYGKRGNNPGVNKAGWGGGYGK